MVKAALSRITRGRAFFYQTDLMDELDLLKFQRVATPFKFGLTLQFYRIM